MTCCRMDGFVRWCQCAPGREEHMAAAYPSCVHHPENPGHLRAWLLEQLDEDERLRPFYGDRCGNINDDRCLMRPGCPDRVALEIKSKRALVEFWSQAFTNPKDVQFAGPEWDRVRAAAQWTLRKLTEPYSHRPGCREEWRP